MCWLDFTEDAIITSCKSGKNASESRESHVRTDQIEKPSCQAETDMFHRTYQNVATSWVGTGGTDRRSISPGSGIMIDGSVMEKAFTGFETRVMTNCS